MLHGRPEILDAMPPFLGGGHMIATVTVEEIRFGTLPAKFEAGTLQVAEGIGLGAAVDFLDELGHGQRARARARDLRLRARAPAARSRA